MDLSKCFRLDAFLSWIRKNAEGSGPAKVQVIHSVSEFVPLLDEINRTAADDHDMRQKLGRILLEVPEVRLFQRRDPFADSYRADVRRFYRLLFGREYRSEQEGLNINLDHELRWGFPYGTQSAQVIGPFLMAYGFVVQSLDLPAGARILELGCGTGSLTWHLAKSGYKLTSVDINESNLALIREMTAKLPVPPNLVRADIGRFETNEQFDAIIFFEAFHHFLDHEALLGRCKRMLAPAGVIAFAAEPIVPDGHEHVPYPWGIRLDGGSLRAMHAFGWIELGFRRSYFFELLRRAGLSYIERSLPGVHWAYVVVARVDRR